MERTWTESAQDLCAYVVRISAWLLTCLLAQRRVKTGANIGRKRNRLRIAQNLNGLLGLIHNHGAIFAMLQMPLKFLLHDRIKVSVDVIRQLTDDAFAIQCGAP